MSKRLTYEHVKEFIEKEGYKLISNEYVDAHKQLKIVCSKNHTYETPFYRFQQGHRCPTCSGNKKLTFIEVKEFIENEGYKLLSTEYEYVNTQKKLDIQCNKGHIFKMNFNTFKRGTRCSICANNKRLTYEYIKEQIEKHDYKLLSTEYVNSSTKLDLLCPNGHKIKKTWNNFQIGYRCPICYYDNIKNTQININEFRYYKNIVCNLTRKTYRKYNNIINPLNLPRGKYKYHLDHRFSIYDGFINKVQPEIISSVYNLQIISEYENLNKGKKSCITLNELYGKNLL
jgi:hypothetical protein